MFAGAVLLTLGIVAQLVALNLTVQPLPLIVTGWVLAGLGIGMAHATSSVLAFAQAAEGEVGSVSAALQVSDQLLGAVATGVGGALFAFASRSGADDRQGILLAFGFVMMLSAAALVACWRAGSVSSRSA
ncbi:MAG: hypothetical protein KF813_12920 [Trueperaceae bacterium]|nr:hypothetical protein [Trueperaceae bacterium]